MNNTKRLIISFTILGIILISFLFLFNFYSKKSLIKERINREINFSSSYFNTFKNQDIKALSATLDSVLLNRDLKEIFIKRDREALNNYSQPLFQKLKEGYGITHFYFHLPEGITFLRVHDPSLYGDNVDRFTFKQVVASQSVGFGIELGKTAFALRVVKPLYDNNNLIGYIELGQEINHFLSILKEETQNEYSLFVDKNYLLKEDWISTREKAGLENNWDEFNKYILIKDTLDKDSKKEAFSCFIEFNAQKLFLSENNVLLGNISDLNACSGFKIFDASDNLIGVVLFSHNFSDELKIINNFLIRSGFFIICLFILSYIFFILFMKRINIVEDKYKYLFDYSIDAVMTLNPPDWRFSDGNRATIDIYGLKNLDELKTLTPSDVSPQYQPDGRLSSEKAKEMIEITMEKGFHSFEWMHKKIRGDEFLANVSFVRVKIGENTFLQAVVRDITEQKKAAELIKKSREGLERSLNEVEKINKMMVGRELDMIKLKEEIKKLKNKE